MDIDGRLSENHGKGWTIHGGLRKSLGEQGSETSGACASNERSQRMNPIVTDAYPV